LFTKDKKFIGKMFDEISPTYDLLNHLFSGGQDLRWRKKAVKHLLRNNVKSTNILDLASGSGDLGVEFLKMNPQNLICADLSLEMLKINNKKINSSNHISVRTDASVLPFEDNTFDLTGIAFGVRNFENLEQAAKDIYRTLKPGGVFLTIEMFGNKSKSFINRLFSFYFKKVMPRIGNILSKSDYAYYYLLNSVDTFLSVQEYGALLESCGFKPYHLKNNFVNIVHTLMMQKPNN
jgi:demethylmenaquinone methyltransferase/2-methoxy-6-polyprenyl-1,4-benzoquinol methylase